MAGLDRLIHPISPIGTSERVVFTHGRGLRLWDTGGREYLDAVSGLWNVAVGYGRGEIAQAAQTAIERFGFASLYFSQGHEFAARLAEELASLTPRGIERFFFTSEGSTAVDTAIRLVRYEAALRGEPRRTKIIARWESYHGSSLGSASVTGQRAFWDHFGPAAPGILHVDQPTREDPDSVAGLEEAILREGPETVAAFIAEPVSLPSGVALPGELYWPRVRELCTRYGIRLIADEIVTGFGRTGEVFALDRWDVKPDLLLMSKGLTSGYVPLAAVGVSEEVYEAVADANRPFMHGFTTSGHPVCAAVALANLEIIEREGLIANARRMGAHLDAVLRDVAARHDQLGDVRSWGLLAGIDLVPRPGEDAARALAIVEAMRRGRMLIRGYDDKLVLAPSLVATEDDIDEIGARLSAVLT
jgi:adenosylmethionine-8-amino-7-oxononanoate aminotransferase